MSDERKTSVRPYAREVHVSVRKSSLLLSGGCWTYGMNATLV